MLPGVTPPAGVIVITDSAEYIVVPFNFTLYIRVMLDDVVLVKVPVLYVVPVALEISDQVLPLLVLCCHWLQLIPDAPMWVRVREPPEEMVCVAGSTLPGVTLAVTVITDSAE